MRAEDLKAEDLRAYARRGWAENERAKREHVAEAYRKDPSAHFDSVCELREHLRSLQPDWPSEADLSRDLQSLIEWKGKIDRAAALTHRRRTR